jgi:hypothetical protein
MICLSLCLTRMITTLHQIFWLTTETNRWDDQLYEVHANDGTLYTRIFWYCRFDLVGRTMKQVSRIISWNLFNKLYDNF